jgi:hypothetical protein
MIKTDHGTNFIGANWELTEALKGMDHSKIQYNILQDVVKWSFNRFSWPHHGGINLFGRDSRRFSIQSSKNNSWMTKLPKRPCVKSRQSWMITVTNDQNDFEPHTKNHLLQLKAKPVISPERRLYSKWRWTQVQYIADLFWQRWIKVTWPSC